MEEILFTAWAESLLGISMGLYMEERQTFPDGGRMNHSAMARKYIPQKNDQKIFKEVAENRGIDVHEKPI